VSVKATEFLKKQHREVKGLFKKMEKTEDARGRRQLMEQISQALRLHTRLEEEIFYPAVRGLETRKAEEMIAEAFEEHHVVKLVLGELPNVDPEDERFEAKMTVLSELIEHHVEEEEGEMFKIAQRLGDAELKALADRMQARMGEGMSRARRAA
jgi:iron-sulfur cluster repair protein YtfE (RIC family)